jgi:iron(III) transport system substrate-binding protein
MAIGTGFKLRGALAALALATLSSAAMAQTASDAAMLSGPDRMDKIIAGAKKEGKVSLYSSSPVKDMKQITAGFEKKYGVKVELWRASSEDIRQRAVQEAHAGRANVDVFETASSDMEAMRREKLLQEIRSPTLKDLIPAGTPAHHEWVTSRISIFTVLYNTNIIKKADAPKSYEDLLDPKFKGKLGIEAEDSNWFMAVADAMGEQKTIDLFRRIVATNGMSVRKGHTLLANLVPSGEVPMALTVYGYKAEQLFHSGAPVQPVYLPPPVALPTAIAVARKAPNPYAGVLFWEYFLTDGQKILVAQDNTPSNVKVKEPPPGLVFIDAAKLLDEGDRWTKLYKDIFVGRAK